MVVSGTCRLPDSGPDVTACVAVAQVFSRGRRASKGLCNDLIPYDVHYIGIIFACLLHLHPWSTQERACETPGPSLASIERD